jgi:hypothetical protein
VEEIHGGVLGGHFGVERTLDAVGWHYWWDGMRKDVEEIMRDCPECNTRGSGRGERRSFIQPAERVRIDFTDMMKVKDGNSKILVMIDHATKFVIVKATQNG